MTEIIENIEFTDFYLTMIRVLKITELFKNKEEYLLNIRKIVMFDYYMRFPFMTDEDRRRQNFDDKYAFYFWKPDYSLYEAAITVLVSKKLIENKEENYCIKQDGIDALNKMQCAYMDMMEITGKYILSVVIKMSDKKIEEDIITKSKQKWEGTF